MSDVVLPSPYPYFGGKSRIAPDLWQRMDSDRRVQNYVEPFFGSGAMWWANPRWESHIATVNELNPFISNFLRAVANNPLEVALYADYPVIETDMTARHNWLMQQLQNGFKDRMFSDPLYYDTRIAGWWVWGISGWIGHGWCDEDQLKRNGKVSEAIPHLSDGGSGINRTQLPHLTHQGQGIHMGQLPSVGNKGKGVHRQTLASQMPTTNHHGQGIHQKDIGSKLPSVGDAGRGVNRESLVRTQLMGMNSGMGTNRRSLIELSESLSDGRTQALIEYFAELSNRLRRVRITCGNWDRVIGRSVTEHNGLSLVFLDPPYKTGTDLYATNTSESSVTDEVLAWCKENWANPQLRIALCGYEGEMDVPADWESLAWKQRAGYQSHEKENNLKERIWLSQAVPKENKKIQKGFDFNAA